MQYLNRSLDDLKKGKDDGREVVFDGIDVS